MKKDVKIQVINITLGKPMSFGINIKINNINSTNKKIMLVGLFIMKYIFF